MKTNWQTKKLGEICDFQRGLTYSKNDEVGFSNNIVLRATNIDLNTNTLNFSELKYIDDSFKIPKDKKVSKGSLIICTASGSKSHLGKVALIDAEYDYAFGGFMAQITPKKEVDSKYLFYIFVSDAYKNLIDKLSSGININNLKFSDLENFEIKLPSLPEQKRIVKILDEAYEKIENSKLLELIVTDSIPLKKESNKIKVVSCAPLFAEVMNMVQHNNSISGKFLM